MSNLEIKQCILTQNDCYKQGRKIVPNKIVVHSTGANNPKLSRYVQPDDGILGDNKYDNDWNRSGISKCVHAFIGKDKNGNVRIYQTLPWNFRPWGCGSGSKGSYNNDAIQFEICEDGLADMNYFNEAFDLAAKLCAYLIEEYDIPLKNVVSHYEAHKLGYASNHGDCDHWLKKFGKNMDWFRGEVEKAGRKTSASTRNYLMKGDKGTEVKAMQESLIYLCYDLGKYGADGDFGNSTDSAVRKFQKDNGLVVDGKYGVSSKAKLEALVAEKKKAVSTLTATYSRTQFIKDVQKAIGTTPDGIVGSKTLGLTKNLVVSKSKNNRHAVVKPLQKYLNALGYDCEIADGIFGTKSHNAVVAYQKAKGLSADGIVGEKSWRKLFGM